MLGCDLMTLSGHKLGAPAGIGALVRPRLCARSRQAYLAGRMRAGMRAGTPNLLGAVAFGAAAEAAMNSMREESDRIGSLAASLLMRLRDAIPGLRLNGPTRRPLAEYAQPHVSGRARREHADCARSRGRRSLDGVGVRGGRGRAVARAARDGPQRRRSAQLAAHQPRMEQRLRTKSTRVADNHRRRCGGASPTPSRCAEGARDEAAGAGRDVGRGGQLVSPRRFCASRTTTLSASRCGSRPSRTGANRAERRGTCCSHDDFEDARRVAERMDFPFYVIDLRADFAARVIDNFVSEYLGGRTPNPCVMCNREIKFDRLWSRARALECRLRRDRPLCADRAAVPTAAFICCARPTTPRISRTFCSRSAGELSRTIFPLGAMTKAEVRARARALGLANADKPESQEICFVPDGDYAGFVERRSDRRAIARRLDHRSARKSARRIMPGCIDLPSASGADSVSPAASRLYVREIRAETGEVVVGRRDQLDSRGTDRESTSVWSMTRDRRRRDRASK